MYSSKMVGLLNFPGSLELHHQIVSQSQPVHRGMNWLKFSEALEERKQNDQLFQRRISWGINLELVKNRPGKTTTTVCNQTRLAKLGTTRVNFDRRRRCFDARKSPLDTGRAGVNEEVI